MTPRTLAPGEVDEVDWARIVEGVLYLFPPVLGVGAVGALREADPGVPLLERGFVLFAAAGYVLLMLGTIAAVFLDARRVRRYSRWRPNPRRNAAFALLAAPVAGVVYLYRRHRRFGTPPGWSAWWLVVAVSVAASTLGLVAAAVAIVRSVPGLFTVAVGVAGAVAFGAFPIAIHRDAAYVCTHSGTWRPNPAFYFGLAFGSLVVPPLQPVVAGYYLLRRRRAMDG
ncbi:hypothetical protein ACFQGT_08340 [Natrialbaceae archaeon GCM10025810]|uniref:hypothetical protein n=1 Tax=Halovalidus salilacus TaxID=3075124 RepID=UPI003608E721